MSTRLERPVEPPARNSYNPFSRRVQGWKIPVACGLGCALIGYIGSHVVVHWYRTNTTLYFPAQGNSDASSLISSVVGKSMPTDTGGVSLLGGMLNSPQVASGPQTAIAVLDSDRCREAVAVQCNLADRWHLTHDKIIERLRAKVSYGVNKDGLLSLEVDDPDPHLAVQIAQAYIDNLRSIARQLSTGVSHRNRVFLQNELKEERTKLIDMEARLTSVQSSARPAALLATSSKLGESLVDLETKKTQTRISLETANSELLWATHQANTTLRNGTELPLDVPLAQSMRARLRSLEAQFQYAQETLGPENPEYKSLQIQVNQLRTEVRDEIQREARGLKEGITPDVASLYAKRAALQAEYDGLAQATNRMQDMLRKLPSSEMRVQQLQDDIKVEGGVVGMLASELERARIVEQRDTATFVVVDHPEVPEKPFFPRASFVTIISFIAGLLVGMAWLVVASLSRTTVMTPISNQGE